MDYYVYEENFPVIAFSTEKEAKKTMEDYIKQDKLAWCYKKDYYRVVAI